MNILLITTIYPLPGNGNKGTEVCHFFAREWLKMGYDVRVVHLQAVYPKILYAVAKLYGKNIAAKTGAVVYTEKDKGAQFIMDEVPVSRIPVFKPIPHGKFSKLSVSRAIRKIVDDNKAQNFIPDYVVGHFSNPILQILYAMKQEYPDAKTADVMHGDIQLTKKVYGAKLHKLMNGVDVWGFRNRHDKEVFQQVIAPVDKTFICYSGIPESYICKSNGHSFDGQLKNFIYVGEMIERKYPLAVLDALESAYNGSDYQLTYVGNGQLLSNIQARINTDTLSDRVRILGRIPRTSIMEQYDKADCFVMISCGEAYGLVYLEALARGCITIASRDEGFDGVIVDGENGFLCKAGDSDELASIITRINAMTPEERQRISDNALETAKRLTDNKAAELYINDVIRLTKK